MYLQMGIGAKKMSVVTNFIEFRTNISLVCSSFYYQICRLRV